MCGGRRLVGCGQISVVFNSMANGLNEAIPSQVWCKIVVLNKLILLRDIHDMVLHLGWSYGVGPKVNMRLFWIAYVCTLSDFL